MPLRSRTLNPGNSSTPALTPVASGLVHLVGQRGRVAEHRLVGASGLRRVELPPLSSRCQAARATSARPFPSARPVEEMLHDAIGVLDDVQHRGVEQSYPCTALSIGSTGPRFPPARSARRTPRPRRAAGQYSAVITRVRGSPERSSAKRGARSGLERSAVRGGVQVHVVHDVARGEQVVLAVFPHRVEPGGAGVVVVVGGRVEGASGLSERTRRCRAP